MMRPEGRFTQLLERISRLFAHALRRHPEDPAVEKLALPDGTPVLVRPIVPEDASAMVTALQELSPASRYQRFLAPVERLPSAQLDYLTHVDGVNHIALGMAFLPPRRAAPVPIAIARCIRDREDPELAEVAIVVADAWQKRGVGTTLLRILARRAWEAGIHRWRAVMLAENTAALKLMDRIGTRRDSHREGFGAIEAMYDLRGPD